LQRNANEVQNSLGRALLNLASNWGFAKVVKFLLGVNASLHTQDDEGRTPLHIAANNDFAEMSKILLEFNANTEAQNCHGETPLHFSVNSSSKDTTLLLLTRNHNAVHVPNEWGETPLRLAVRRMEVDMVRLLLSSSCEFGLNHCDENGWTHLHALVQTTQVILSRHDTKKLVSGMTIMHLLCDAGIDLDSRNSSGQTALQVAAKLGLIDVVNILVQRNADQSTIVEEYGCTALALAERIIDERRRVKRKSETNRLRLSVKA
jgi:ankyrin repeat protein